MYPDRITVKSVHRNFDLPLARRASRLGTNASSMTNGLLTLERRSLCTTVFLSQTPDVAGATHAKAFLTTFSSEKRLLERVPWPLPGLFVASVGLRGVRPCGTTSK